ncbi:hypothetical protein SCLCIDRAFT_21940 [Scleroderma citrinum Foug A]|uniref:Tim44-like domain-containing protein n=1 Tax=Scleroderma citrinum Foug A TaxID=1036808 RepID=A0A0C3EEY0_9AGAM|nr:hypothetical protein SCLCIDRAFT_21940 [Scleroderma citrinum Foug A]
MLPRHLRNFVIVQRIHSLSGSSRAFSPPLWIPNAQQPLLQSCSLFGCRSFHASHRRQDELLKSPFQTFVELQGDVDKLQDSEALKRAKEVYERARLTSSIKEDLRLRVAAEELKKAGIKVGDAVSEALKTMEESEVMRVISCATSSISSTIAHTMEPIRNTTAYKTLAETVIDALDDSSSAKHAGFKDKEGHQKRWQKRLTRDFLGGALSLRTWKLVKLSLPSSMARSLGYLQGNEPVDATAVLSACYLPRIRVTADYANTLSHVNHQIMVQRERGCTGYEDDEGDGSLLYKGGVRERIERIYCTRGCGCVSLWIRKLCQSGVEATYNVLWATMKQYLRQGLISDSKVLDIRQVDVSDAKILENEIPVFVVTFSTQEVLLFRNPVSHESSLVLRTVLSSAHMLL